jgi:hypothetical protein
MKERNRFNDKVHDIISMLKRKDPRMERIAKEEAHKREEKRREKELEALAKQEEMRKFREERAEMYRQQE